VTHRPRLRPFIALLAAPIAAGAPTVITAAPLAAEEEPALDCTTEALTAAEVAAGAISEVTCVPHIDGGTSSIGPRASVTLATHYTGSGGTGDALTVTGSTCDGSGIAFSVSSPWNNEIRSTRNGACANAKHFSNADYTGSNQTASGSPGTLTNIGSPLNAQISSVRYGA
jgi:hypothetical protein